MMRACGINPLGYSHHNEHLAPICVLMDMPLLLTDEMMAQEVRELYPKLRVEVVDWQDFDPAYLFTHYDVLFRSDIWDTHDLKEKLAPLAEQHGKTMRTVHCPHGWSDKTFWFKQIKNEDLVLMYGQNMLDVLTQSQALDRLNGYSVTGNLRYQYYLQHKQEFDSKAERDVWSQFEKKQKLILYTPTWYAPEQSSSFYEALPSLVEGLPDDHNLLIKLHPELLNDDVAKLYSVIADYSSRPNVVFLEEYPLIYPLLAQADVYVGDTSSIGYDFLAFNRPMFFLDQEYREVDKDREAFLFRCGTVVTPKDYGRLGEIIEEGLLTDAERYGKIRKEVYAYSFGNDRPWTEIRDELTQLIVESQPIS